MREVFHREHIPPCPFLPEAPVPQTAAAMKEFGSDRGPEFYLGALTCAQSLWLQGLPAQAILQLNRAFSADIGADAPVLEDWPLPYTAMVWILRNAEDDQFIGNPRRHFQHLATRMSGPRGERRIARAWACWHLARLILLHLPADDEQIAQEGIREPQPSEIEAALRAQGIAGEAELWLESCQDG